MLMIQVILTNKNTSAWVDDTSTTPAVPGSATPGVPGKGGDTEIVPPPPTGVPSTASTPADVPPVTGSGPSAPVPVSPLPTPKS